MGRTVVVRLATGTAAAGRLAARLHDVATGTELEVRDADELVAALRSLSGASEPIEASTRQADHSRRGAP